MAPLRLHIGAAARPYPGEAENGDAWTIDWHEGGCRLALIDGLGHGAEAAAAAAAAVAALNAHRDLPVPEALALCHRSLKGTRGAALSIAAIDPLGSRMVYAGVGNVEAQLWQASGDQRPISYRGIVGVTQRQVRSFEFSLAPDWLLVLYTDGVSNRFDSSTIPGDIKGDPQALADFILEQWGRERDDATVLVARA
jgi:serine phosphatase RsbU (regulator of sigma subunit)